MGSGNSQQLAAKAENDIDSVIEFVLPTTFNGIPDGSHKIDDVTITVRTITDETQDPILKRMGQYSFGASGSGFDLIPFYAFTDNRGNYPAKSVRVCFNYRLAKWLDPTSPTGEKRNIDPELAAVVGAPKNQEKVQSLIAFNKFLKHVGSVEPKSLQYDDITAFNEIYYQRYPYLPIVQRYHSLATDDAYRKAVYDFVLPSSEVTDAIQSFSKENESKLINSEEDLLDVVKSAMETALRFNIEHRRWIEPFWDGQRKIIINDTEHPIPRTPKSETKIQPTLHVLLDMALLPLGVQVTRETDEGIGSLDFRFLYTTTSRQMLNVGAEFKVAHHQRLKKGINSQLPAYLKAIRSTSGLFVVMWFKDGKYFKKPERKELTTLKTWLAEQAQEVSQKENMNIESVVLDASIRVSASNLA